VLSEDNDFANDNNDIYDSDKGEEKRNKALNHVNTTENITVRQKKETKKKGERKEKETSGERNIKKE